MKQNHKSTLVALNCSQTLIRAGAFSNKKESQVTSQLLETKDIAAVIEKMPTTTTTSTSAATTTTKTTSTSKPNRRYRITPSYLFLQECLLKCFTYTCFPRYNL